MVLGQPVIGIIIVIITLYLLFVVNFTFPFSRKDCEREESRYVLALGFRTKKCLPLVIYLYTYLTKAVSRRDLSSLKNVKSLVYTMSGSLNNHTMDPQHPKNLPAWWGDLLHQRMEVYSSLWTTPDKGISSRRQTIPCKIKDHIIFY
jgi:hypothetical protein